MRYTKLFIDVDDTLLDFKMAEKESLRRTAEHFGIPFTSEFHQAYHEINISYWKLHEQGLIGKEEFLPQRFIDLLDRFGYGHLDGHAANTFYHNALCESAFMMPGAEELLKELSQYAEIWLVTNGDSDVQTGRLYGGPLMKYVKGMFISDELGAPKPSKEFFDIVFGTVPHTDDMLIIGDSLTSDIRGGENAAMDSCWFNPEGAENTTLIRPTYTVRTLEEIPAVVRGEWLRQAHEEGSYAGM